METSPELPRRATRGKVREYTGPLGILAAGAIGISLLCSVSAMAMGDLNRYIPITLEPINLVDLAVSNFGTAAALTEQVVTVFVPTATITPTNTEAPPSATPQPTDTQRQFVTITPTFTKKPRGTATRVVLNTPTSRPPTRPPTRTNTPRPTATNTPRPTNTPIPTSTTPSYPDATNTSPSYPDATNTSPAYP